METFEFKHSCGHKAERSGEFEDAEAKQKAIDMWGRRDCFKCIKSSKKRGSWSAAYYSS